MDETQERDSNNSAIADLEGGIIEGLNKARLEAIGKLRKNASVAVGEIYKNSGEEGPKKEDILETASKLAALANSLGDEISDIIDDGEGLELNASKKKSAKSSSPIKYYTPKLAKKFIEQEIKGTEFNSTVVLEEMYKILNNREQWDDDVGINLIHILESKLDPNESNNYYDFSHKKAIEFITFCAEENLEADDYIVKFNGEELGFPKPIVDKYIK